MGKAPESELKWVWNHLANGFPFEKFFSIASFQLIYNLMQENERQEKKRKKKIANKQKQGICIFSPETFVRATEEAQVLGISGDCLYRIQLRNNIAIFQR